MIYCDFCSKDQEQVKRMIAGDNGVAICNECVILSMEFLLDEVRTNLDNVIRINEKSEVL